MNDFPIKNFAMGIVGGIAGGIVGGFICKFLADQGFYAGMVPGALVGLGFSLAARQGHLGFGVVSGILGLLAGLITEWKIFHAEQSFFNSIVDLKDEGIVTWIMLGIGTVLAFSIGMGNKYNARKYSARSQKNVHDDS
jgi:hypothetical protein